ncbi:hypothetical protein GCM10025867_15900 [Frondihabitans sucicola]|uniref:DUF11 domain-containing protein n=1 Tax=Frondihabitans sucicola TaxID=1268041 RepID=A0ABM8GLR4_9MICO|nr:Ig-like domain-containing protein [Frondihabitans sucicola]BDZ49349.1 hypothetical protein GCM10025867_15900 [Frondihabitans sucicola]
MTVNTSAANSAVTNTAGVTFTNPITGDTDTSTTQTTSLDIAPAADLAIAKRLDTDPVVAGRPVSYTITASNTGPQTGTGVRIADTVPAGLTGVTASGAGATCATASGTITCTVPDLAVGATQVITVTGTVPAGTDPGAGLSNTATISGSLADPDRSNDTASASGTVTTSADLSMTKTLTPAVPVAGDQVTYRLTSTNSGPSDARDVTFSDPLDPGVTFVSAAVPDGTCSVTTGVVSCDVGTIAAGATVAATVVVRLAADVKIAQNSATVASSTPDPTPGDNVSSVSVAADTEADLRVTKAVTPTTATAGDDVTYTLHALNAGPSDALNAVLDDTLPTGITVTDVQAPPGATCGQPTDGSIRCQWATLASGADATVTVTATVAADAPAGALTNTASIASPTPDPDTENNAASVDVSIEQNADLSLTKTADPATAVAGKPVTFTISATNAGPSVSRGVVITDPLPRSLVDAASSTPGCTIGDAVLICQVGDIAPGDTATALVTATVPSDGSGTNVVNTAQVASATPDSAAGNDSATATVPVEASADLSVTKTAADPTVRQGRSVQYTITVRNAGPSDAQDVSVQDQPGTGVAITAATPSVGTWNPDSLVWSVGNLADGATATLQVTGQATISGSLTNEAIESSVTPDPDTADQTATATVTSTAVTPASASPDTATASFDRPATANVLANDTPSTGATFDASSVRLRDDAGNPVAILDVPGTGQWSVDTATGEVTFTPVAGFVGTVTVPYQVTDSDGTVAASTVSATIAGPPTSHDDTATTDQGDVVTVPVLDNDSADGTTLDLASLRFVDPDSGALVSTLTVPDEGTYSTTPGGEVVFTPLPTFSGTATPVTYSVADDNGDRSTAHLTVTVDAAPAPSGVNDAVSAAYNQPVTFSPTSNDDTGDPGAAFDPSSVRLIDPASGDPVTEVVVAGQGTYAVDTSTGLVTFTPLPSFTGAATPVAYTATTTFGAKAGADITVTVGRPDTPTATDDAGYAPNGRPVPFSPLDNDNAGPAGTTFDTGSLRLIDPATGDPATRVVIAGEGTWTVDTTTGAVVFTPDARFSGAATPIDYTASTNVGDSVTGSLSASVGTAPTAAPDSATVPSGRAASVHVLDNDAPGGTATLDTSSVRLRDASGAPVTTLVVPGKGTWSLGADGTVVFTPVAGFAGTVTAPYEVSDSDGNTAVSQVTVTVAAAPRAVPDVVTTGQGTAVTIDPLANDVPSSTGATLDRSTLRLIDPSTGQPATSVVVPGQGTWAIGSDGRVTFTPVASFSGTADPIRYRVTDTDGITTGSTITATVTETAPTAKNDTATSHGGPVTLDPLGNDSAPSGHLVPSSLRLIDPSTGGLVTRLTIPGEGTYVVDTATGQVTFTPVASFSGTSTVRYSVADTGGDRAVATLSVAVVLPPPTGITPNPGPGGGVTVTIPGGGQLAFTGSQLVWPPVAVGTVLLLLGVTLIVLRRRRRGA